ncbi:kinesin-like protein KIF27 [Archocentrus centrarchus]|uniref:kinesin-like protein KIF27 n=1 Tax=Archocentrus centrarchus TaxID=63155 RepID=UPI0011EA4B41|nr:kinesin-like protein KIF27 [Archocentrus centrarchus]
MSDECVRVAVRIRPLLPKEVLYQHKVCVRVVPQTAQVMLGEDRLFSFDHAFGASASQDEVYESCVHRLVESLVDGDNATVFCYGQTGSGKTYTLGGANQDEEGGIIDRVAQDVFLFLADKRRQSDGVDVTVKVTYMELYREELRDLLELQTIQKELSIREDKRGNTVVVGAKEVVVTSAEELLSVVEMGNALRHTGTTGMNVHSSRSHTILTLQVILSCHNNNSSLKSFNSSKLCLVDLAGSERAGKTGNTGARLKETAYINTGLLALGNVIRALSEQGNSGSVHIPYRDAKITRLLRDSLGGTAHTLMVVCVSPSHHFVAETLSVLQFASKARYIHNRPAETSAQTEVSSRPTTTWYHSDARLGELEYEAQTLRELLKEKDRELEKEREKTGQRCQERDGIKVSCQTGASDPDKKANPEEASQYRLLAEEAAVLLADISGPSSSLSFRLRLQDWQERLTAVSHSSQTHKDYSKAERDELDHFTPLKLREELKKCQEALHIEEQLLEQKDAELRQVQKELEQLLQERKAHLISLEEVKQRFRIQTEQLVNQQILIDRLRSKLMTASGATVEAGGFANSGKRPHSVPLIRHSCIWRPPRKIHSSPPAYTLERVMAAFKMRGHLLLAETEEKDEVYCPFLKQQAESEDGRWDEKEEEEEEDEVEEDDTFMGRTRFRCSLNQTWTSRQKKSTLKEKNTGADQTCDGKPVVQQAQRATGTKENQLKQRHMRKARIKASATERRVHDLSVSMRLKEELIKVLDKTEKETQFLDTHDRQSDDGREASVFARLSLQSQRVRAEMYHSLQHMRAQQSQLQSSPRNSENSKNGEQSAGVSAICKTHNLEHINEQLCGNSWLEEEEEYVLQKRAELRELEEEMRSREEVLLHREACLEQKSKLETKMLCSSQTLSQDLLHVSMQLESLQEQLQSNSNVRKRAGVTIEELEKARDMFIKRRDTLDAQLKDNQVLTVEETHSLLQLEEAIEVLNAVLEFKNRLIQDKKKKLLVTNFSLHQSQNAEPAQICDVTKKLMDLTLPEALQLLVKYFNKVVCLREAERYLHLRCEELELHAEEQKMALREMEAVIQRLSLDADRRLTQQHSDHQHNIQLLLQKLKEGAPGETQQAMQDRLRHLEKELFFYKSTSRQLKKKLKALLGDALYTNDEPSCSQEPKPGQKMQICSSSNESQTHSEEIQTRRHIVTMYTKIHAEQIDKKMHNDTIRNAHQTKCPSLSSDCQSPKKTEMPEYNQILTQSQGKRAGVEPKERLEMTPVRLCRRDLKQICPADLQVSGSATGRRQSAVDTSTETMLEDSIEVPRNSDR